jgi:hypothetical protein
MDIGREILTMKSILQDLVAAVQELTHRMGKVEMRLGDVEERLDGIERAIDKDAVTIVDHERRIRRLEGARA